MPPNLFPYPTDKHYKQLANTPVLSDLIVFTLPVFKKPTRSDRSFPTGTKDPVAARQAFFYKSLPTQSLITQWNLQDITDIRKAQFQDLTLLYGQEDITVDNQSTIAYLTFNLTSKGCYLFDIFRVYCYPVLKL